jgi:hypothetical protein
VGDYYRVFDSGEIKSAKEDREDQGEPGEDLNHRIVGGYSSVMGMRI